MQQHQGCSNFILLQCRASMELGWGKEWCQRLYYVPQLKETKVITDLRIFTYSEVFKQLLPLWHLKQNWFVAKKIHNYFRQTFLIEPASAGWAAGCTDRLNAEQAPDCVLTESQLLPTVSDHRVQDEVVIDAAWSMWSGWGREALMLSMKGWQQTSQGSFLIHVWFPELADKGKMLFHGTVCSS